MSDTKREPRSKAVPIILVVFFLLIMLGLGVGYFIFKDYYSSEKVLGANEVDSLVNEVAKSVILPGGPVTIATVVDKKQLEGQPLFKNAENGDKVLIYPESKKAILYRPSIKKVVDIGPVVKGDAPSALPSPSLSPSPTKK